MGHIVMSKKELNISTVVCQYLDGRISQKDAASRLSMSVRQIRRIAAKISEKGPSGLVHKSRGRRSSRKASLELETKVLQLMCSLYIDFGPTLASEKLNDEHGITVSREWLRKLLIANGLWRAKPKRNNITHYPRARRECYGELIQIDGSHHAWFEERAPKCVALVFVDDSTGKLQHVHFCETEDLRCYIKATMDYLVLHGCPKEIYTDKHSVFTVNNMRGGEKKGKTQYARILQELNIEHHLANSPQAKGRVERMNRTLQDRLVKEFRLKGISSIKQANEHMLEFIEKFNNKFAVSPIKSSNLHLKLTSEQQDNLDKIFSIKEPRTVSKALTVQHNNKIYAINNVRAVRTLRKRGVTVHEMPSGKIRIYSGDDLLDSQFLEDARHSKQAVSRKELDIKLDSVKNLPAANQSNNTGHFHVAGKGDISTLP